MYELPEQEWQVFGLVYTKIYSFVCKLTLLPICTIEAARMSLAASSFLPLKMRFIIRL